MGFTNNYYIIKRCFCVGGTSDSYTTQSSDASNGYLVRLMSGSYALVSHTKMSGGNDVAVQKNFAVITSTSSPYNLTAKTISVGSTSTVSTASDYNIYLYIGDGNTDETTNDYKLAGNILSYSLSTITKTATKITNGTKVEYKVSITNNSGSAYTINEFGIAFPNLTSSSPKYQSVLIYRKVLSTPIELAANETAILQFTVTQTLTA